ncbi:phospholipase D-like domain-containing protein [Xenorhabdus sp. SGI246]|uniref:phospholipase D-like domain-containing protein n=1 Tax=Xenorhabdus sp. SGI246 TaxID=3158263 RepID=UPI00349F2710
MENKNIYVKVPFHFGIHKFKIFKGHRWGALDHFLLLEISHKSYPIDELSSKSNLPQRLIIEIIIPFMKLGWVELVELDSKYHFRITENGRNVANLEELPYEREPMESTRRFLIDPKTAKCYRVNARNQNYQTYKKPRANELLKNKTSIATELNIKNPKYTPFLSDVLNCVEDTDEEVIGYEERVNDRPYYQNTTFAIAQVDEADNITGVPSDISKELADDIIAAANLKRIENKEKNDSPNNISKLSKYNTEPHENRFEEHFIDESEFSIISGAESHRDHLIDMIDNAISRIIIHSTFIQLKNFQVIFQKLVYSAQRGVQVDILWGQEEPDDERNIGSYNQFLSGLSVYRDEIVKLGLTSLFTIHSDPTGSHAKVIVCDTMEYGYGVTIGSCNWLASGFNRYECSVFVTNNSLITEILDIMSIMSKGKSRVSNYLSKSISAISYELKKTFHNSPSELSQNKNVKIKIVTKNEHHDYVLDARDNAQHSIFIASHRISNNAERPILTPLISSMTDNNNLNINMYYSSLSGGINTQQLEEISDSLRENGIFLEKKKNPISHAKILSWDNDHILITSLNWLSASAYGNPYDELGFYIEKKGIFSVISNNF